MKIKMGDRLCGHQGHHPGPFVFCFYFPGSLQRPCYALLYFEKNGRVRVAILFTPPIHSSHFLCISRSCPYELYQLGSLALCLLLGSVGTNYRQEVIKWKEREAGPFIPLVALLLGCGLVVTVLCYLKPDLCLGAPLKSSIQVSLTTPSSCSFIPRLVTDAIDIQIFYYHLLVHFNPAHTFVKRPIH